MKFSLCPPVSPGRRLGPQHLKGKHRVIVKAKHKIVLLGSYLMCNSSNLLWSLVAPIQSKGPRLSAWFWSSREHVCLSDEWYSLSTSYLCL